MQFSYMEVEMNPKNATRVELAAAQALVTWKKQFASLVRAGASELAVADNSEEITFKHYQQAAEQAIQELGYLIKSESNPNERRHAA